MRAFISELIGRWRLIPASSAVALAGMCLIALGVAFVYLPAGLITGGVLLILAAVDMRS